MLVKNLPSVHRDIPHEAGAWMRLRYLNWSQLEEAEEAQGAKGRTLLRSMGGEVAGAVLEAQARRAELEQGLQQRREANYDDLTLLKYGIEAWSYSDPVTVENIRDLDPETKAWAALELVNMALPKVGDERKNSSPAFIDSSVVADPPRENGYSPVPVSSLASPS